eukprot:COSAG03_NODE_6203_length_1097_cov_2.421844_1_plen_51_part_10
MVIVFSSTVLSKQNANRGSPLSHLSIGLDLRDDLFLGAFRVAVVDCRAGGE